MKLRLLYLFLAALTFTVSACSSSSESDPKPTTKPTEPQPTEPGATVVPPGSGDAANGELGITLGGLDQDKWEEIKPLYVKDTTIIVETSFEATEGGGWYGGDYTGSTVNVDLSPIYSAFKIEEDQFFQAIEDGSIQYVAFNSDGEIITETTAQGYGYWFDAEGDVCNHGSGSVIAVETTNFTTYVVSQYPGAAQKGNQYIVKQGFVYNVEGEEFFATIQINVNVLRELTPADFDVVKTFNIDIETSYSLGYDGGIYEIPSTMYNQMAQSIGLNSLDNVKYVTLNADGSQAGNEPLGIQNGWFNKSGSSSWGDGIVYFNDDSHGAPEEWNYGCHPQNARTGDKASVTMQFQNTATLKAFNLKITITVVD